MLLHFVTLILGALNAASDAACPDGFVTHGESCYHFSHDVEDWTGARVMCELLKSHLVEVNDRIEGDYLSSQVKLTDKTYWMGGNDVAVEGDWVWSSDSRKISDQSYTNWNPGEPNNDGNENCLGIYNTGKWNDDKCQNDYKNYICERPQSETIVG